MKQAEKTDIAVDLAGPLAAEYGNTKMAVDLPVEEFTRINIEPIILRKKIEDLRVVRA